MLTTEARERTAYDASVLGLIAATLFFNYALCFINTRFATVGEGQVILAEAMVMAATWGALLLSRRPVDLRWLSFALAVVCCSILVMFLREEVLAKTVRDLIIIPTFVLLGMQYGCRDLSKPLIVLCAVVVTLGVFEAAFTDAYVRYFDIIRYFIAKGATPEEQAAYNGTSLFVSGIRTDGRILGDFLGKQRVSSIFLEPVSSAMFAAIVIFYTLSVFDEISRLRSMALLVMAAILLVMTDGRLAMGLSLAAVAVWAVLYRLPKLSLFLYLPAAVALAFGVGTMRQGGDDIVGRLGTTAQLLASMDLGVVTGGSGFTSSTVVDSGIAYLIGSIGLFGTVLVWCSLCSLARYDNVPQRRFAHMICLYLSLSWLVSSATFTIKTAGLLWFLFGTLQPPFRTDRRPRTASGRQPDALPAYRPAHPS